MRRHEARLTARHWAAARAAQTVRCCGHAMRWHSRQQKATAWHWEQRWDGTSHSLAPDRRVQSRLAQARRPSACSAINGGAGPVATAASGASMGPRMPSTVSSSSCPMSASTGSSEFSAWLSDMAAAAAGLRKAGGNQACSVKPRMRWHAAGAHLGQEVLGSKRRCAAEQGQPAEDGSQGACGRCGMHANGATPVPTRLTWPPHQERI